MERLQLLDCTLRDGGYINNWRFSKSVIRQIVGNLCRARIDIVECGFLRDIPYDPDVAVFSRVEQITPFIAPKRPGVLYVAMIAVGDIKADAIKSCDGTSIDGIRVTFHSHEKSQAFELASNLMNKGYLVFLQPVGTTSYSDRELLVLVEEINRLRPYAFYLVDTLGELYPNDLLQLFHLVNKNLHPDIVLGFHSHNNLQLSFANALTFMTIDVKRRCILDASVFGMGRGAGNLCTELVAQYINTNVAHRYEVLPLLEIADNHLLPIFRRTPWCYTLPYFLSATDSIHPNYASNLLNRQTLNMPSIGTILHRIPKAKRDLYDQELIEELYLEHQSHETDHERALARLRPFFENKRSLLLLAPGSTLTSHRVGIEKFIAERQPFTISLNFLTKSYAIDMLFISNQKRFSILEPLRLHAMIPAIVTSNILIKSNSESVFLVNYPSLLGYGPEPDNAAVMMLRLLEQLGFSEVYLAGMDGFSANPGDHYFTPELNNSIDSIALNDKNAAIRRHLRYLADKMTLHFLTPSLLSLEET